MLEYLLEQLNLREVHLYDRMSNVDEQLDQVEVQFSLCRVDLEAMSASSGFQVQVSRPHSFWQVLWLCT
jgi:hypothetical protein